MKASSSTAVTFLGIGLMGSRQARRLLEAGYQLTVWNRSREKAEALVPLGAQVAETAVEAVQRANVIILMLENGAIVSDVLFSQGFVDALRPGSIIIDMSSIKPAEAQDHARHLAERGVQHIDAPVSGGTVGAEQGTLAIMAGGNEQAFSRVKPILEVMGRPVHVGPHGAGQLAKLANQIIVGVTIGAVAEALLLAQRGGADPAKVREALRGGFAESRILELHGQRMVERDFITKGRSVTHLKDLDNALDAAERLALEAVPYTALTADLFRGLIEHAGDLDHSGLLVELERRNVAAR
ncbi:2-hydroxy-3-oxopropionate reductase [Microvirga sp. KLBC 81]|uniref:NAD(P)-dependent oxidoreductase n=1 Tax=Microvirga sp. KLBC 81 TaxID=1862707 RepID=UPI000D5066D5|nr:NAD(P)-dependent oxidoreductase [Microvirga sp. KLBC 81]PVE23565.1 2-hydroxy-3-oxopropionate reductase [Microvirga sp. KLBC 81]